MKLSETYKRVRPGIVAFAPRFPERIRRGALPFEFVFGTGFIVDDSLIATNAHVVDCFEQFSNDQGGVDVAAMTFMRTPGGIATVLLNVVDACRIHAIEPGGFYYGSLCPDVAIVSVNCTGLSKFALMLDPDEMPEGTAIATAGFPTGHEILHLEGQFDHAAPTPAGRYH
jgi:hypothetical protein